MDGKPVLNHSCHSTFIVSYVYASVALNSYCVLESNSYVQLNSHYRSHKLYAFIKSALVSHAKYRCFSFQHRSTSDQSFNLGWGRRVQLLVDGNVHVDRELKQANRSLRVIPWQLELVEIPRFLPDSLVQIQLLLCSRCDIDLKNFVFTSQPCTAGTVGTYITLIFYPVVSDVDECAVDEKNNCSHTCENTFGGYVCSCPSSYQKLESDNRTCQCIPHDVFAFLQCIIIVLDQCTPPCGSSQTCTDRNRCVCPEGYFGYRDCLIGENGFV